MAVSLLLITSVSMIGCVQMTEQAKPFNQILPGKSILHYSQFEPISDFNSGISKNRYGKEWKVSVAGGAKLALAMEKSDSVSEKGGGSLRIHYEIPAGHSAAVKSELNGLDVSRATLVVGRVKTETWQSFNGGLSVSLRDDIGAHVAVELKGPFVHPAHGGNLAWSDVEIPKKMFRAVDFNRLKMFELIFDNPTSQKIEGDVILDELAFFGPEELVFQSMRDNLKSFPDKSSALSSAALLNETDDQRFLAALARDAWRYFDESVDQKTGLVLNHIRLGRKKGIGNYTSPTDVAFYLLSCVAAADFGFISKSEARKRVGKTLSTLARLETWKDSFYYNYYNTTSLGVTRRYVSSVDNGWLVAALAVIRQAFPEVINTKIQSLFKKIDFAEFYDETNGQLRLGFDEDQASYSPYHYGLIVSEARLMSYVAIAKNDFPRSHWAKVYRTLPKEWKWQRQEPQGAERTLFGEKVFEGYYSYDGEKIVPSWGGSLFEFLAPALVLNENELAKSSFSLNNRQAVKLNMAYAAKKKYPVWGISPAAVENGRQWVYREYGITELGAKGYPDEGVVTPHASVLALEIAPEDVIQNLRKMLELYPGIYGPCGFYDSVDVIRGKVNEQYLALDQGMIFVALANYLKNGSIRNRFHQDPIGKAGEILLTEEKFF